MGGAGRRKTAPQYGKGGRISLPPLDWCDGLCGQGAGLLRTLGSLPPACARNWVRWGCDWCKSEFGQGRALLPERCSACPAHACAILLLLGICLN